MKTIFKTIVCASILAFTSCGDNRSEIEKSADEFCECFKKEKMKERNNCTDDWKEKYKGIEMSEEQIDKMTKRVEECSDDDLTAGRYKQRIRNIKK
ncbi:MAG: hypothetical protein WDZ35_06210 [Crocinitomicaceae bacterium]